MECRPPLVTAEEVAALFGRQPRTVRQELERLASITPEPPGLTRSTIALRRLIAQALQGAANVIAPR